MNRFKISTVLFLFTLLVSGTVFSQTNYTFSASGFTQENNNYDGSPTLVNSVTGSIVTDNSPMHYVLSLSNLTLNGNPVDNWQLPSGSIYILDPANAYNLVYTFTKNTPVVGETLSYRVRIVSAISDYSVSYAGPNGDGSAYGGNAVITAVGGAPEIDGSLAPKVGFLLACLFLMFGRRKQSAKTMLAV